MCFKKWLLGFQAVTPGRAIGDLARDIAQDNNFPETDDPAALMEYLESNHAVDAAILTFQNAYCYYCLEYGLQPAAYHLERAVRHIWEQDHIPDSDQL